MRFLPLLLSVLLAAQPLAQLRAMNRLSGDRLLYWADQYAAATETPVAIFDAFGLLYHPEAFSAWVDNYAAGIPDKLLLLSTDHGLANTGYFLLECDGSPDYTVTSSPTPGAPGEVFSFSALRKTRLGYLFAPALADPPNWSTIPLGPPMHASPSQATADRPLPDTEDLEQFLCTHCPLLAEADILTTEFTGAYEYRGQIYFEYLVYAPGVLSSPALYMVDPELQLLLECNLAMPGAHTLLYDAQEELISPAP